MLIKEFISETNKNQMISTLLKYYGVSSVRMVHKPIKDHAHFDYESGTLQLSTKYKTIKPRQIKEFLITIIHEIRHAMDAKKYGWRKFRDMYEWEMNYQISQDKNEYKDNKYEIEAEQFGQKNHQKWYNTFKKQDLF